MGEAIVPAPLEGEYLEPAAHSEWSWILLHDEVRITAIDIIEQEADPDLVDQMLGLR